MTAQTDSWWDHPLLDAWQFSSGSWSHMPERFEQYVCAHTTSWQRVLAREGAWLPEDARMLYTLEEPGDVSR